MDFVCHYEFFKGTALWKGEKSHGHRSSITESVFDSVELKEGTFFMKTFSSCKKAPSHTQPLSAVWGGGTARENKSICSLYWSNNCPAENGGTGSHLLTNSKAIGHGADRQKKLSPVAMLSPLTITRATNEMTAEWEVSIWWPYLFREFECRFSRQLTTKQANKTHKMSQKMASQ